jgi:hypothetical protein
MHHRKKIQYCGLELWSESVVTLVMIVLYILTQQLAQMDLDFALALKEDWLKYGNVIIGNNVEMVQLLCGSWKFSSTVLGDGCKI